MVSQNANLKKKSPNMNDEFEMEENNIKLPAPVGPNNQSAFTSEHSDKKKNELSGLLYKNSSKSSKPSPLSHDAKNEAVALGKATKSASSDVKSKTRGDDDLDILKVVSDRLSQPCIDGGTAFGPSGCNAEELGSLPEPMPDTDDGPSPSLTSRSRHASQPGAFMGAPGMDLQPTDSLRFSILTNEVRRQSHSPDMDGSAETGHSHNTDGSAETGQHPTGNEDVNLAVASPVDENAETMPPDLPLAEGVDPDASKANERANKTILFGIAVVLVLGAILVTMIALLPDWGSEHDMLPPSLAPSQYPTHSIGGYVLSLFPDYTVSTLEEDKDSPQHRAYTWLMEDPNLMTYTDERIVQRYALATFFYATNGETWSNNDNWLDFASHECTWYTQDTVQVWEQAGILQDLPAPYLEVLIPNIDAPPLPCQDPDRNKSYSHLSLALNNLNGEIPPQIHLLTSLKSILLGPNNQLKTSLSTEIGTLTSLEAIVLTSSGVHGSIPSEVGLLSNLHTLHLGRNKMSGTIPTQIGSLSNSLELLDLLGNQVTGTLPTSLGSLNKLELLGLLIVSGISGSIPSELGRLEAMKFMTFSGIGLEGQIPSELGLLTNIVELFMYANNLTGTIPEEMSNLVTEGNLELFHLYNNMLSGVIPQELCLTDTVSDFQSQSFVGCNCTCSFAHGSWAPWNNIGDHLCSPLPDRCS